MLNQWVDRNRDGVILLARVAMMLVFVHSGFGKLTDFQATVAYMQSLHAPTPQLEAVIAVVMEFFIGIALAIGLWVRPLAALLVLFALGASFLGHPFWTMEGADRAMNLVQFLKNISIAGGLLLLVVTGGGRYALRGYRD